MNPLAIRIAADLKAFKANMDEMRTQLETNQAAMKRMANAFDGNRVIGDANAMVKAISDIGGASRLTEAEQRRVNATVTEALAKYKALGREAPPELLALRDATNKVEAATRQVQAPVDSLSSKLKGLAGTLGIAFTGAAVVSGIKSLISNTFEYAETIKDTSAKLAISMEATQRFKFAAEQTGASLENVSKSILKLSQGVAGGDKGLKEALESAGIQFESIKGMKPEDAFNLVADAIAKIPDPMMQADVALAAFGKSGAELLPALREGFVDISREVKVMSDATINALDKAKDKWEEFSNKVTVATGGIIAKILGMMEKIAPSMQLLLTLAGQFDAAEMWSVFAKGADKAKTSVDALTASQKSYVDQLIRTFGIGAVKNMGPEIDAYVASLKRVPPVVESTGASMGRAAKEADKFKMSLPGVKESDGVTAFFDSIRVGSDEFLMTLPGVKAGVQDFIASIRVGTDQIESDMMTLPGVAAQSAAGFVESLEARNDDLRSIGRRWADGLADAFGRALEGLGGVIVGAIQGGGDVARSVFASIGLSLGNDLGAAIARGIGGSLGQALGGLAGPIGSLLGSALGGLLDRVGSFFGNLFGRGNNTRDARERAAQMMGFADSTAMYNALRQLGAEGQALVNQGLNVIGRNDTAANEAWIRSVEALFARLRREAEETGQAIVDAFQGPEGARGFPTRFQLQMAAKDAKATYQYMLESGMYTTEVLEEAWRRWQDAAERAGDTTSTAMRKIDEEIKSLSEAIALETPEFDEMGNRIYGVVEAQQRARLQLLEEEKAATLAAQSTQLTASVAAAITTTTAAKKKFDETVIMANDLDANLRRIFSVGYEIPITFRLPGGLPGGAPGGSTGALPSGYTGPLPAPRPNTSGAAQPIIVITQLDGREVARNQVQYIPAELDFVGARR